MTSLSGGANTFAGNEAGEGGGAIFGLYATLSGGTNLFADNRAGGSGGAISVNGDVFIMGGVNTFVGNIATSGHGGAIFNVNGPVYIANSTNLFSGNEAGGDGGAIYSKRRVYLFGDNLFSGNEAGGDGGAIRGDMEVSITSGSASFTNNRAGDNGGAVFSTADGLFIASGGNLLFRGNTHQNNGTAVPNAIYLNLAGGGTLRFAAEAGQSVLLYDPVAHNSANTTMAIDINKTGSDSSKPAQEYEGRVVLDMSDYAAASDRVSAVYGATTVHNGTFALLGGATYGGSATTTASFLLKDGATLEADAVANTVRAADIELEAGSSILLDMARAVADAPAFALSFDSAAAVDVSGVTASDKLVLELQNFGAVNGTYNLVHGSAGTDFTDTYESNYQPIPENVRYADGAFVGTVNNGQDIVAIITGADDSRHVYWDGTAALDEWNELNWNWNKDTASGVDIQFKNGDHVHFGAGAAFKTVTLGKTMYASDMTVEGGSYTFVESAGFTGTYGVSSTTAVQNLPGFQQKLRLTGSGTRADFHTDLYFEGGLEITAGATMGLGVDRLFTTGAGNGAVTIADGATMVFYGEITAGGLLEAGSIVANTISIGNATLVADLPSIIAAYGGQEVSTTVMTASDALTIAAGAKLKDDLAFYSYEFIKNGDTLEMHVLPNLDMDFSGLADSPNGQAVGGAFDWARDNRIVPDGALGHVVMGIFNAPTVGEAKRRQTEASGAVLAGGTRAQVKAAKHFRGALGNVLKWKWAIDDAEEAAGDIVGQGNGGGRAYASLLCAPEKPWRFWAEGVGGWNKATTGNDDPGYEADIWGGAVAGMRSFGDFSFGAALGASHVKMDWDQGLGETKGDSFSGGLFAAFERSGWFAMLDGVWGTTDVSSRRRLPLAGLSARADYRTHWYGGDVRLGHRFRGEGWSVAPSAGARWYRFNTPGVTETGAGTASQHMQRSHQTSFELFGGVEVARLFRLSECLTLRPRLSGGVTVETADKRSRPYMSFVGAGLPAFAGYSPERGRWAATAEAGLEFTIANRLILTLDYQGEYGKRYQYHAGKVGVGVAF